MKEARYVEHLDEGKVRCLLCPHNCLIQPGRRGICAVRENRNGTLMSLNYGKAIAVHNDPIEKKPLFHVLPGSTSLSVATVGCNLSCSHCQNYDISQHPRKGEEIPGQDLSPMQVVQQAKALGSSTISFTYSEPTIFIEWAEDIAELASQNGIGCISVTNGYTSSDPIRDMATRLLAANVDLKSFRQEFYHKVCGAKLQPVLDTIKLMRELGIWVEVTTLVIPDLNDDPEELRELAEFLVSVDPAIPWHLSRFHPDYRMTHKSITPSDTIHQACEIGLKAGLKYVYSGNLRGDQAEHTYCPNCREVIISRLGFSVYQNSLINGCCPKCHTSIEGVWS